MPTCQGRLVSKVRWRPKKAVKFLTMKIKCHENCSLSRSESGYVSVPFLMMYRLHNNSFREIHVQFEKCFWFIHPVYLNLSNLKFEPCHKKPNQRIKGYNFEVAINFLQVIYIKCLVGLPRLQESTSMLSRFVCQVEIQYRYLLVPRHRYTSQCTFNCTNSGLKKVKIMRQA